jgi:hypothetical protein
LTFSLPGAAVFSFDIPRGRNQGGLTSDELFDDYVLIIDRASSFDTILANADNWLDSNNRVFSSQYSGTPAMWSIDRTNFRGTAVLTANQWNSIINGISPGDQLVWFVGAKHNDPDTGWYYSGVRTPNVAPKAPLSTRVNGPRANSQSNQATPGIPVSQFMAGMTDVDIAGTGLGGVAVVSADTSIATLEYRNSVSEAFQQLEVEANEQNAPTVHKDGEIRITTTVPFIGTWDEILELVAVDFDAKRLPQALLGQRNYGMAGRESASRCYATLGHLAVCA